MVKIFQGAEFIFNAHINKFVPFVVLAYKPQDEATLEGVLLTQLEKFVPATKQRTVSDSNLMPVLCRRCWQNAARRVRGMSRIF